MVLKQKTCLSVWERELLIYYLIIFYGHIHGNYEKDRLKSGRRFTVLRHRPACWRLGGGGSSLGYRIYKV